ncbi:MAG: aminoglycoside phosphotransferase family protein [Micromonosporaceae bacterium]|nr:aminoglycoside phosphotransferase family protein [Micromonosporaceae bacterium]
MTRSGRCADRYAKQARPAQLAEPVLHWVRRVLRAQILAVRPMSVSSTTLHAVDARTGTGNRLELVVRQFHDLDRLARDPWYSPANEAAALGLLASTEVPAPRLLAEAVVDGVPVLLITRLAGDLPGHPEDVDGLLSGLARALATLHAVPVPDESPLIRYRPYHDSRDGPRHPPQWTERGQLWRRLLERLESPAPAAPTRLIHRDFHPGQTLWRAGRITGVVDWTTACRGPAGIDLAHVRVNLALDHGAEIAERLLPEYRRHAGTDPRHPYWDLLDAADMVLDMAPPQTAAQWAQYKRFEDWVARVAAEV